MDYKNQNILKQLFTLIEDFKTLHNISLSILPKAAIINGTTITFVNHKGEILFEDSDIVYEIQEDIKINPHDYVMKNIKVVFYDESPLKNYAEFLLYLWRLQKYFDVAFKQEEIQTILTTLKNQNKIANIDIYYEFILLKIAEFEDVFKYLDGTVPTQAQVLMQDYTELNYPNKQKILDNFEVYRCSAV